MEAERFFAIISWILLPTVMFGGYSLLRLLATQNGWLTPYRQKFFRAGHAHAGVLLILALVFYTYLSQTTLAAGLKWFVCIMLVVGILAQSGGFFLNMLLTDERSRKFGVGHFVTLLGAILLAGACLFLAYGLLVAHL